MASTFISRVRKYNMVYRFKYEIIDENDNLAISGSTYILPESIHPYGTCESVDIEVGSAMRNLKIYLRALAVKMEEIDDEENAQ